MKKLITIAVIGIIAFTAVAVEARINNSLTSTKYQPVTSFLESEATFSQWFKQYKDTTSGTLTFKDFLKRLSSSDVLWQRSKRAGVSHNQLYSPITTLVNKNWNEMKEMNPQEQASVRISMLELDIALSAVEATLPRTALEEFRREVLRGAKPLSEVAKLPESATDTMIFTIKDRELSDRLNTNMPGQNKMPRLNNQLERPQFESHFWGW